MADTGKQGSGSGAPKPRWRKWLVRGAWAVILLAVVVVGWPNLTAELAAWGRVFDRVEDVPGGRVGLVFGCDDRYQGRENLYFRYRIDAAVELWRAGKVRCLLVSGDNRSKQYNEPQRMKNALIERGVPASKIACDFAGLRTLDSVVRAREVFGLRQVTFISQRFQNERAIYLARVNEMDAVGYNAKDVESSGGLKTKVREIGARVKMWLDVNLLGTRPRHLGEPVKLPD